MSTLFLVLGVIMLTVLAIKGVPIFYCSIIASIFVLLTAGMDVISGMTSTYAGSLGNYLIANFFIFTFAAIFGKIVEMSGSANSIADFIVSKIGPKFVVPAIIIAGGIMAYGGISVYVGMFTLYPLMFAMFERVNISRTLAPGIYLAAAGSFAAWMPGSPAVQVLQPVQVFGTSTFAAAVPGFITVAIEIALEIVFCVWYVKYTQKKGLGWEGWEALGGNPAGKDDKKKPNFIWAIIPMVILIASLGILNKYSPVVGLTIGIVAALIIYAPFLPWKSGFWNNMQTGFMSGCTALMATCSAVGFGGVIESTEAFQNLVNIVTGIDGSPIIISVAITAVLAGICGSGIGGQGMALPMINTYFAPMVTNLSALTRALALSCTIFTLPSNAVVNSSITAAHTTHKQSYFMTFITLSVMSFVSMVILLILFAIMGYM